jgi:HD superfamily phosphohydrolase
MISSLTSQSFLDPLYGRIALDEPLLALMRTPTVQRMRHIRLSNIDSMDMPSIANLSRFEHVLGVVYLASNVGFRGGLTPNEHLVLRASALLHDWAITSFGHLVEEALQYVGTSFNHEEKLAQILLSTESEEIGGADLQILVGRESKLRSWASRFGGGSGQNTLTDVMNCIRGRGKMGRVISGTIDLDNIDNVFRMAFHMGLDVDCEVPRRLAGAMVGVGTDHSGPIFRRSAECDIQAWRSARREVYEHLMLSERDFTGKLMMLFAAVRSFEAGEIKYDDWSLVDHEFIMRLLGSATADVSNAAQRWIAGELWDRTPLRWMSGERPTYPALLAFSNSLGTTLGRPCFAYAIKDKRDRHLSIQYDDGTLAEYGETPNQWLFGVGSPRREVFTAAEVRMVTEEAGKAFNTKPLSLAHKREQWDMQESLF